MNGGTEASGRRSVFFWPLAAAGLVIMAVALRGLFAHRAATNPFASLRYVVAFDLVHDLVLAPVVLVAGAVVTRLRPRWLRAPLAAGLFTSAVVVVYSYPAVRGYGRIPDDPSRLPLDYTRGLVTVLGLVWLGVALAVAAVAARSARTARSARRP